ncbi:6519_t:CDS:1, partial [Dentiscutata erythropus]
IITDHNKLSRLRLGYVPTNKVPVLKVLEVDNAEVTSISTKW